MTASDAPELPPIRDALPPCAESVAGLAHLVAGQSAVPLRSLLLRDPGLLLLHLSECHDRDGPAGVFPSADLERDAAARLLRRLIDRPAPLADWSKSELPLAYRQSQLLARLARRLALKCEADPDQAEVAGLLSNLGDLARHAPLPPQRSPDQATRGLARRWPLPRWLTNLLLALDLDEAAAAKLHANPRLVLVLRAARGVLAAQSHAVTEALAALGCGDGMASELRELLKQPAVEAPAADAHRFLWPLVQLALTPDGGAAASRHAWEAEAETLRGHLAEQRRCETDRLRQAKLRALAEFAAGAGHEINNPLAVISGQAQYLRRSEESPERIRALERIVAQSQRIHETLKSLMFFARPPTPQRRRVALAALVRGSVEALHALWEEREVAVEVRLASDRLAAEADAKLVGMAVAELLRNAIEASPRGGQVSVTASRRSTGQVEIAVADHGPGLSPAQQEHLFDPFYSGRQAGRGVGLGLSKAWRIAELHGGSISYESAPGQPTRFVLTLPEFSRKPARAVKPSANGNGVHKLNGKAPARRKAAR